MLCKFLTAENLCTGRYNGFACIRKQCSYYQEAQKCEFHESTGDYCRKYGRFGCVGKGSCESLSDYLSAVAEEERA